MGDLFKATDREKEWVVDGGVLGTAHVGRDGRLKDFRPARIMAPRSIWEGWVNAFPSKGVTLTLSNVRVNVRRLADEETLYSLENGAVYAAVPIGYWYNRTRCGGCVIKVTNPRPEDVGEELPDWVVAHYAAKSAEFGRHHAEWEAARQVLVDEFPGRLRAAAAEWANQPRLRARIGRWIQEGGWPSGRVERALEAVPGYEEVSIMHGTEHIRQILADM